MCDIFEQKKKISDLPTLQKVSLQLPVELYYEQ